MGITQKWMVYAMENPSKINGLPSGVLTIINMDVSIAKGVSKMVALCWKIHLEMDDLGVSSFMDTPIL